MRIFAVIYIILRAYYKRDEVYLVGCNHGHIRTLTHFVVVCCMYVVDFFFSIKINNRSTVTKDTKHLHLCYKQNIMKVYHTCFQQRVTEHYYSRYYRIIGNYSQLHEKRLLFFQLLFGKVWQFYKLLSQRRTIT